MASQSSSGDQSPAPAKRAATAPRPDWADGLRQLYDSVVDEPLPDTFKDLLDRLDHDAERDEGRGNDGPDGGRG